MQPRGGWLVGFHDRNRDTGTPLLRPIPLACARSIHHQDESQFGWRSRKQVVVGVQFAGFFDPHKSTLLTGN